MSLFESDMITLKGHDIFLVFNEDAWVDIHNPEGNTCSTDPCDDSIELENLAGASLDTSYMDNGIKSDQTNQKCFKMKRGDGKLERKSCGSSDKLRPLCHQVCIRKLLY